jgi:hypothetical protein
MDKTAHARIVRIVPAVRALSALHSPMRVDVLRSMNDVAGSAPDYPIDQFLARVMIRTFYTHAEAMLFALKRIVLTVHHDTDPALSLGEQAMLREETYDVSDKGDIKARPLFLRFAANLRFTFAILSRVYDLGVAPDYSHNRFQLFIGGNAVRNRLTHPKSAADLDLSLQEIRDATHGHTWFVETFEAHVAALNARAVLADSWAAAQPKT